MLAADVFNMRGKESKVRQEFMVGQSGSYI